MEVFLVWKDEECGYGYELVGIVSSLESRDEYNGLFHVTGVFGV